MNRREFLLGATGVSLGGWRESDAMVEEAQKGVKWPIGCFNRPWSKWSFDEALDGMKAAGFREIGLLGDHKGESFIYPEATPDTLDALSKRIAARGLKVIFGRMRTRHNIPLEEAITEVRKQVDNAAHLKIKYLMALGADRPEEYDHFYKVMAEAAAYAKPRRIQIVFKPHGGVTAASEEIERCIERVNHPNFRLWYDAGNIIHYTDKDPVTEAERVARYTTGFCAKDCAMRRGEVMLQFGEGRVDFLGVFQKLKAAGFKGPVMIECCGGQTPAEVTEKARANRLFLERLFPMV
jgi:sugar phosphate isomerase/epimerase